MGKTYENRGLDAEMCYLDIAQNLGWVEDPGAIVSGPRSISPSKSQGVQSDSSDIWDNDESSSGSSSRRSGVGMGTSVSAMARPPQDERDAKTIHGLAISDNASALSLFLQANQDADVNEFDEHVRIL